MKNKGIGKKYFIIGGFALSMIAGAMLLSSPVCAELTSEQVLQSYDVMMSSLEGKVSVPEDENEKVPLRQKSLSDVSEEQTMHDEEAVCELLEAEMNTDDIDQKSAKVYPSASHEDIEGVAPIQTSQLTTEQKLYILQALNLQDAYAVLQSGVIENLRLFGYIDKIELDRNSNRIYSADEGDAFTKLLYLFYPSNSGDLSVNGGGDRVNCSKYDGISPDMMAKFCAILNDYRSGKISRIPKKNVKVVFSGIGCRNKINRRVDGTRIIVQGSLADFLKRYGFDDAQMCSVETIKGKEKISFSKAIFCYDVVKILLDCVDLENETKSKYPQYLTEHILMSYMIKTLNKRDEIERFYREIVIRFTQSESQNVKISDDQKVVIDGKIVAEKIRLAHLNEIIKSARFIDMSPYKTKTKEHKTIHKVGSIEGDQVQIMSDTFADCADITLRHLVNLLVYSDRQSWDTVLKDADVEDLDEKLKKVVVAINNNSSVEFYDLKTRLQMFFLYQRGALKGVYTDKYRSENCADDETKLARILWAYVICNMDTVNLKKGPDKDKGYYEIQYCDDSNVALDCGYINLLKLMWNVAQALGLGEARLSDVRKQIDGLSSRLEDPSVDISSMLKNILSSAFTLFHEEKNLKIDIVNCKCEKISGKNEITGEVKVKISKSKQVLRFVVTQMTNHAKVEHNPVDFTWDDKFISEEYSKDDIAKLLLRSFTNGCNAYKKVSDPVGFYGDFSGNFVWYSNALSVLKVLQDEGRDIQRIGLINSEAIMHAEKIQVKQKLQSEMEGTRTIIKKLSDVFYEEYLKPNEDELYLDWDQSLYVYEKNNFGTLDVYSGPEHTDEQKISGFEVIKTSREGNEVRLLIDYLEKDIVIPIELYDINGKKLKVSIGRWDHLDDLETVVFKGDCEDLKIMQFTFKKELGNLRSVNFLGYVKNLIIGESAFYGSDLTSFTILGGVSLTIKKYAFVRSQLLNFAVLGRANDLLIGDGAFECSAIESFSLQGNVTNLIIETNAFAGSKIASFKIFGDVTNVAIGRGAFSFKQFRGFQVLGNILNFTIGKFAFAFIDITSLIIPSRMTNLIIDDGAFLYSSLESFVIPEGVKCLKIGAYAFKDSQLANIDIPEGVMSLTVDENAFAGSQIENFTVPESVTDLVVGARAFADSELTSFTVLGSETNVVIDDSAFENCDEQIDFVEPPALKRKKL